MTIGEITQKLESDFQKAGLPDAQSDARFLVSHSLGLTNSQLILKKNEIISIKSQRQLFQASRRHCRHEPVAAILGYKDFFQDRFLVSRHTLIPRVDSEHLLYALQESGREFNRIFDIGTGTGVLALSCARLYPKAEITALDIDVRPARRNIKHLNLSDIRLVKGDFLKISGYHRAIMPQPVLHGPFDLILSNPPYLAPDDFSLLDKGARGYEPERAFAGGADGLDFYRAIARYAVKNLAAEGWIVVETDHKWARVDEIFQKSGFVRTETRKDYGGLERVIVARR